MDIILINIKSWISTNCGLAIIDPFLRLHGMKSKVISSTEIEKYLDKSDVFGLSVLDHTYEDAKKLTHQLQDKTVIWGGWTSTALPEYILNENPGVDYIILREGENRLLNLLKSFKHPGMFDSIDGIAYRDDRNKVIIRPPKEYVDMDKLPISNDLATLNDFVFIELSRGCYGGCHYCQEVSKMRFKSAHKTAEDIRYWYAKGYRTFHLGNANSLANGPLLDELVTELETTGFSINLRLVGRPEDVLRNRDIIYRIFQSSTIHLLAITFGIEGNTQHALDLIGRRSTPEMNRKAISSLVSMREKFSTNTIIQANMIPFTHFDMTFDDLVENIRFIGDFGCSRDTITPQLHGLANTPIWTEMTAQGFKQSKKLGLRIFNYTYSDKIVDRIYKKLVHELIRTVSHSNVTDLARISLTQQLHDKFIEFYLTGNIKNAVMDFLKQTG